MTTSRVQPDAIILACWPCEDSALNQLDLEPMTTPFADKPMLERVIEKLARLQKREIVVVLGESPELCRNLLGDGERWGCHIHYCYALEGDQPLSVLSRFDIDHIDSCIVAPADTSYHHDNICESHCAICWMDSGFVAWTGWANLNGSALKALVLSARNRVHLEENILQDLALRRVKEAHPICTSDVRLLLNSLPKLFNLSPGINGIMRHPRGPQTWIGNGSFVHADAVLCEPVYIGNHVYVGAGAYIGPNSIIQDGCVIEKNCIVTSSYIAPHTYVGSTLEIAGAAISGIGIANIERRLLTKIDDRNLLASLVRRGQSTHHFSLFDSMLALLLWCLLSPLAMVIKFLTLEKNAVGACEVGIPHPRQTGFMAMTCQFSSTHELIYHNDKLAWCRHFAYTFVPGLIEVIKGKVRIIGLQPRTVTDIEQLPEYWQRLYRCAATGLLNDTLLLGPDGASSEMRFAGDIMSHQVQRRHRVFPVLYHYLSLVFSSAWLALLQQRKRQLKKQQTKQAVK
ncbi:hypothetical protein [Undibacterium sp.]|uniref:hypothetical protein n=1 Tax=Undibacterium sp. TaxID=1914977 RepID=UPI003751009D